MPRKGVAKELQCFMRLVIWNTWYWITSLRVHPSPIADILRRCRVFMLVVYYVRGQKNTWLADVLLRATRPVMQAYALLVNLLCCTLRLVSVYPFVTRSKAVCGNKINWKCVAKPSVWPARHLSIAPSEYLWKHTINDHYIA